MSKAFNSPKKAIDGHKTPGKKGWIQVELFWNTISSNEPSTHHAFVRLNVGRGQQRVGET